MAGEHHNAAYDFGSLGEASLEELKLLDDDYVQRGLERLLAPGCGAKDRLWQDNDNTGR